MTGLDVEQAAVARLSGQVEARAAVQPVSSVLVVGVCGLA